MIPPANICKRLYNIDHWARLGWAGQHSEELNAGRFVLVKLLHKRDFQRTVLERWRPSQHGPLYNRYGSTALDYDTMTYFPVWVGEFSREDVFSGKCLDMLRDWNTPFKDRQRTALTAAAKDLNAKSLDISEAVIDQTLYEANKTDTARLEPVSYKFHDRQALAAAHNDVPEIKNIYEKRLEQL